MPNEPDMEALEASLVKIAEMLATLTATIFTLRQRHDAITDPVERARLMQGIRAAEAEIGAAGPRLEKLAKVLEAAQRAPASDAKH